MSLADRTCVACRKTDPALSKERAQALLGELSPGWTIDAKSGHLERLFKFPDFAKALAFVNQIGAIAEREQHHPDLHLGWGRCQVEIWTHAVSGLSENDFILAAKIDRV